MEGEVVVAPDDSSHRILLRLGVFPALKGIHGSQTVAQVMKILKRFLHGLTFWTEERVKREGAEGRR